MLKETKKKLDEASIYAVTRAKSYWTNLKYRVDQRDGQAILEYSSILIVVGLGVLGAVIAFKDVIIEKLQEATNKIKSSVKF